MLCSDDILYNNYTKLLLTNTRSVITLHKAWLAGIDTRIATISVDTFLGSTTGMKPFSTFINI